MELYKGVSRPSFIPLLCGSASFGKKIYYSTGVCNRILALEQENGRYEILHLGMPKLTHELHIVLKGASTEGLWIGMGGTDDIWLAPWDVLEDIGRWRVYHMPEGYEYVHDDKGDIYGAHSGMYDYGRYMVIFPFRSPHLIKLDKTTGGIEYIGEDFFRDSDKKGIGYELKFSGILSASCIIDCDRWLIQRSHDLHMAVIDLRDGSYEEFVPEIPEEIFDKLVPEDAGFYKGDIFDYYRMSESRLFPLEHFLEVFAKDGYKDVRDRQIEALSTLAANLDGTCGIKTHEFLKKVIEEGDG